jgi:hypothetical protein
VLLTAVAVMAVPVAIAAYGPARPEEQAEMRRPDVSLAPLGIWVRRAAPELTTGRRVVGETKSEAGERFMVLPGFMQKDVERHLKWFAQKEPNGLLFVGEKGAPFRRTSFRPQVGKGSTEGGTAGQLPRLRSSPHRTPCATQSGATLKDTMVRAGQSSERAALIHQHSNLDRQKEVAAALDDRVRAQREAAREASGTGRVDRSRQ